MYSTTGLRNSCRLWVIVCGGPGRAGKGLLLPQKNRGRGGKQGRKKEKLFSASCLLKVLPDYMLEWLFTARKSHLETRKNRVRGQKGLDATFRAINAAESGVLINK